MAMKIMAKYYAGKIYVPAAVRRVLKLRDGDIFEVEVRGDSLILTLKPSEEDLEPLRLMEDARGVGVPRLRRREIYEDTR
ncbi:MAG: hypothetical protein DRK00_03805 [Thermoprotei archaeon]|nr:MAG: hypothetical protein DRK00_03805 [Thermoprotei archaeon]